MLSCAINFSHRLRSQAHVLGVEGAAILQLNFARVVDIRHHAEIGLSMLHDIVRLDINFFDVLVIGISLVCCNMCELFAAKNTRGYSLIFVLVFGAARLSSLFLFYLLLQSAFSDRSSSFTQV